MLKRFALAVSGAALLSLALAGCDFAPLGQERQIARGYRVYRSEDGTLAIFGPGESAGSVVTQIGWRKPYIVTAAGEAGWQVFDTSSREFPPFLTAEQLRADPRVRDIPLLPAEAAWDRLSETTGQW